MSDDRPTPLEVIVRAVVGVAHDDDDDQRASTFARGLALGALVGAAIAGSTIWQRRQADQRRSGAVRRGLSAPPIDLMREPGPALAGGASAVDTLLEEGRSGR